MEWNPFRAWKKAEEMADRLGSNSKVAETIEGSAILNPTRSPEEVDARTRKARKSRVPLASQPAPTKVNTEGKGWLPRDEWLAGIDNPAIAGFGTWARFEYVDGDGVVTNRHIRQWSKRGAYIEGFCMQRREGRLFRQDRINGWVSG